MSRPSKAVRRVAEYGEASKKCPGCSDYLTMGSFHRSKASHDGRQTYCLRCNKARKARLEKRSAGNLNQANQRLMKKRNPWSGVSGKKLEKVLDSFMTGGPEYVSVRQQKIIDGYFGKDSEGDDD